MASCGYCAPLRPGRTCASGIARRRRGQCSPAEVRLVISTLEARFIPELPERLIGDKAYDGDPLAAQLTEGDV